MAQQHGRLRRFLTRSLWVVDLSRRLVSTCSSSASFLSEMRTVSVPSSAGLSWMVTTLTG